MDIAGENMQLTYFLHKIKHELCFVNNVNKLNDTIWSVSAPIILTNTRLNATDGRSLMQRIIFQQFNSGAAKTIGFMRGMITLSSEPDIFEVSLMLNCSPDQISEPNEAEWIAAIENGLEAGNYTFPTASKGKNAFINAFGLRNYIYDMRIEFWPHFENKNGFECECVIKYIQPEGTEKQELDFSRGFDFLIYSEKARAMVPFLIKSETNPVFILQDANIISHELYEDPDGIGKELFIKCEFTP